MTPNTDTLRIVLENVDFRLPTQVTDDNSVLALKSLVFEPLVKWKPNGVVEPGLFVSWTRSPDARSWRFTIREDAEFHDGEPCTAESVVAYINGFLDSHDYFGMKWSYARYFANTTFVAEDLKTVQVQTKTPFADLLNIFNDFWPSRSAADGKPVLGTGPYRVIKFERHDGRGKAVLEIVDHAKAPQWPGRIEALHEPSGVMRLQQLRRGEVDVALNLERVEDLTVLDLAADVNWGRVVSTLSVIYYLNCFEGIFINPDVRIAANLAVDNDALVKEVYRSFAVPSRTVVSPLHLGYSKDKLQPNPHDPEQARKLLQEVDLTQSIVLRTPEYMPEHAVKISKFVASSLEAVGFKVEVELETNRPEYARSIGLRKQIGDLALFDSTPNTTFRVLDDKVSSANNATWWMGYHDEEFQNLFAEARGQPSEAARVAAYEKCLQRLQQNPPWLYISHPEVVWASRKGVKVGVGPSGVLSLEG